MIPEIPAVEFTFVPMLPLYMPPSGPLVCVGKLTSAPTEPVTLENRKTRLFAGAKEKDGGTVPSPAPGGIVAEPEAKYSRFLKLKRCLRMPGYGR